MSKVLIDGQDAGNLAADWALDLKSDGRGGYNVGVIRKGERLGIHTALATFLIETSSSLQRVSIAKLAERRQDRRKA